MENFKKSKRIALGLIEETKDYTNSAANSPDVEQNIDLAIPSTSYAKRPTEIVKYGKITFNTTAILHHYPQVSNNELKLHTKVAKKKSDLNLEEGKVDNNNATTPDEVVDTKKDNFNNNDNLPDATDNTAEVINQPVKFTEEKLV